MLVWVLDYSYLCMWLKQFGEISQASLEWWRSTSVSGKLHIMMASTQVVKVLRLFWGKWGATKQKSAHQWRPPKTFGELKLQPKQPSSLSAHYRSTATWWTEVNLKAITCVFKSHLLCICSESYPLFIYSTALDILLPQYVVERSCTSSILKEKHQV